MSTDLSTRRRLVVRLESREASDPQAILDAVLNALRATEIDITLALPSGPGGAAGRPSATPPLRSRVASFVRGMARSLTLFPPALAHHSPGDDWDALAADWRTVGGALDRVTGEFIRASESAHAPIGTGADERLLP